MTNPNKLAGEPMRMDAQRKSPIINNVRRYLKQEKQDLTAIQVREINRKLAYEFIETRLEIPSSSENVEKLALFIEKLEQEN